MAGRLNGSLSQVSNISNLLEQLAIHGGPRALDDARLPGPRRRTTCGRHRAGVRRRHVGRYHGPHGQRLTQSLAELHQLEFVGLLLFRHVCRGAALRALKIGPGDEVIVPAYRFSGKFSQCRSEPEHDACWLTSSPTTGASTWISCRRRSGPPPGQSSSLTCTAGWST